MKLALGPLQYGWPREAVFELYREVARAPVDIVYLGEIVCPRRHELAFEDWLSIGGGLAATGKEVVLSAQPLTESEGDLKLVRRTVANGRFRVEANDWGAARLLEGSTGWVAGPHLNVYNPQTLALLHGMGARRWVAPVESARDTVAGVLAARPGALEAELFAHGRLPLAFSARCFTARRFGLQKENCEFRCLEFPDGMRLDTREGRPFLVANGVQTQSAAVYSLVEDLAGLREAGVGVLRVNPQSRGTGEVLAILRACCDGALSPYDARKALSSLSPGPLCSGFWHGRPGLEYAA